MLPFRRITFEEKSSWWGWIFGGGFQKFSPYHCEKPSAMSCFDQLSDETLFQIFSILSESCEDAYSHSTLGRLAQVCLRFRQVAEDKVLWKKLFWARLKDIVKEVELAPDHTWKIAYQVIHYSLWRFLIPAASFSVFTWVNPTYKREHLSKVRLAATTTWGHRKCVVSCLLETLIWLFYFWSSCLWIWEYWSDLSRSLPELIVAQSFRCSKAQSSLIREQICWKNKLGKCQKK